MSEAAIEDMKTVPPDPDRFAVTEPEYYHLLRSEGPVLTIWNARDLNVPSAPKKIDVPGLNPQFQAYDMGCCLVVAPVSFVASGRSDGDTIQAAHSLMVFAIKEKHWDKVELTGLDTMVNRAAMTAILLNTAVLRYTITEKFKKVLELTREARPDWLPSGPAPAA